MEAIDSLAKIFRQQAQDKTNTLKITISTTRVESSTPLINKTSHRYTTEIRVAQEANNKPKPSNKINWQKMCVRTSGKIFIQNNNRGLGHHTNQDGL